MKVIVYKNSEDCLSYEVKDKIYGFCHTHIQKGTIKNLLESQHLFRHCTDEDIVSKLEFVCVVEV